MVLADRRTVFPQMRFVLLLVGLIFFPLTAAGQDSAGEGKLFRGDKGELSITVKDSSGAVVAAPATVKVYRSGGTPVGQSEISQGRAFFIVPRLGDYTVIVDAAGYKTATKDVSVLAAVRVETEVYLRRDTDSDDKAEIHGPPLLAPKAKEVFDKGLQALTENNLDRAEKDLGQALKLAPSHPDVLYANGVLHLRRRNWAQAQSLLEKATQLAPNHSRALAALGMAFADQGKYDAAIPLLEKSLQLDAGAGFETRWALGKSYYYHQQYDQALKTSQEALQQSSGKAPEIELLVAQSLTAVGRYEDAGQALRDFLAHHADLPQAATAKRWLERLTADGKIGRQ